MGWAAIIAAIMEIFGPLLSDWLKECTEDRLSNATADLPPVGEFVSEGAAAYAMFDAAIADLPRFAFIRRRALERMRDRTVEGAAIRRTPLTADELREARDIVRAVRPQ